MKIAMCRAYLTDAQIHVLTALSQHYQSPVTVCVCVCVFVWQPGKIMANAHSEFPIKSAQTALFVWRLSSSSSSSSSCCHFYLAYSSILFWFTSPAGIDGILMAFANYSWKEKKKKKGKKTEKRMKKRQLKMFEIVSLCENVKNSSLSARERDV